MSQVQAPLRHELSRRSFLSVSVAAGAATLLAACGGTASLSTASVSSPASSPTSAGASAPASAAPASASAAVSASAVASPSVSAAASAAGSPASSTAARVNGVQLPTYIPFQGPKPDFPASSDGIVPPGYLTYPKDLIKTWKGPLGKGEDITIFTYSINPPATPVGQNPAWQQINKDLGVNLKAPYTALQDYGTKLPTIVAGGDLPDALTMDVLGVRVDHELDFMQSQMADLTPYVSGDAVKDYPNLANLATLAWKNTVFGNKIYALPRVQLAVGDSMLVQQNMLDQVGVKAINSIDDYTNFMKAVTKPGQLYGVGGIQANTMQYILAAHGAPNNWAVDSNGKFTKDYETPTYKQSVQYLRQIWDMGLVHPDTPTMVAQSGAANFYAGKYAMYPTDFFAYVIAWGRVAAINKDFRLNIVPDFAADGKSKPQQFQTSGINQITAIKKASADRVKEMLHIMDYLASPFGTQEYLTLYSGIKGTDFDLDPQGNPVLTKQGQADVQYSPWGTIISPPPVLQNPSDPKFVSQAHPQLVNSHQYAVTDPTVGLFSNTDASKRAILTQKFNDSVNNIIFGRADVSTLDQAVKDWRSGGGDQIRSEYEQAYSASK
ncbi:MAG: twin-arginine translocation signal domain-containing protein [Chloroflexi bacterium]|nr:twin-arginine translocation signal domain-containing protein [Chloroflexota bacterium]